MTHEPKGPKPAEWRLSFPLKNKTQSVGQRTRSRERDRAIPNPSPKPKKESTLQLQRPCMAEMISTSYRKTLQKTEISTNGTLSLGS